VTKIAKAMQPAPFTPEGLIACVTVLVNKANDDVQAWWKLKASSDEKSEQSRVN